VDLDPDDVREALQAQIAELLVARDETDDENEDAAIDKAIMLLEHEVDLLDIGVANHLGERVDAIINRIDKILNEKNLDAASALGRTVHRLRNRFDRPAGNG